MALSTVIRQLEAAAKPLLPVGTTFKTGRELVENQDAPPRVVWAYGPTDDFAPVQNTRVVTPGAPRALMTRTAGLEAFVWGEDYDQVEDMVNGLIGAIYEVALGSMRVVGGAWAAPAVTANGRAYRLSFTVNVPITEAMPRTGTATSAPQDVALQH